MLDDNFMDPKMPSNLDPKLKEAYERVMGTTIPKPSAPPTPAAPSSPNPTAQIPTVEPTPQTPPTPAPSAAPQTMANVGTTPSAFVANPQKGKSGGISPVIIFLGLLVFFIVYALFWLKFFNVSLPFLP